MITKISNQTELVSILNLLSESERQNLFDFALFLFKKRNQQDQAQPVQSLKAVEETWGSITLPRNMMKYIAENKEIEYEF